MVPSIRPAFAGDNLELTTWVANFRRVRSLRRYRFVRLSDNKLLAEGETEWVCVNTASGRPSTVPAEVQACFTVNPNYALPVAAHPRPNHGTD